jgi:hypothetical protein
MKQYTNDFIYHWKRDADTILMRFPFWPREWDFMPNVSVNGTTEFKLSEPHRFQGDEPDPEWTRAQWTATRMRSK